MQRIATLLVSLLATLGILSADHHESAPPNTLTDAEKEAGWILLFDGSDAAAHWRNYQQDGLSEGWVVENGELIRR
ncbi:MAG: glucose dehydrogenase, partial [Verrucomicrobiota bacterium]